jgi:hypothetical protein
MFRKMTMGGFVLFALMAASCARTVSGGLFPKDETYAHESLRTVARIREGSEESWHETWSALADWAVAAFGVASIETPLLSTDGDGGHCQAGASAPWTADLFQWLSERE